MRFDEYFGVRNWRKGPFKIEPFEEWKKVNRLGWYQDYNEVKHNRHSSFQKASSHNAIKSIGAVLSFSCSVSLGRFLRFAIGDDFNWPELQKSLEPFVSYTFK